MTTAAIHQSPALEALGRLARIERAIDQAYEPICQSLDVKDRAAVDRVVDLLREEVKGYLYDQHLSTGETVMRDRALDFEARLQFRKTTTYNLPALVETAEGKVALATAATAGMLRVTHGALAEFRQSNIAAWAELMWNEKYRIESPEGVAALMLRRGWRQLRAQTQ
jgi:hypothetical protein